MHLGDVLSMAVGEIIPIEIVDPVTVYVDGLPVIRGKYGVKNGRYAVKVNSIQHPAEYLKAPLERGRLGPSMMRAEERGSLYQRPGSDPGKAIQDTVSRQGQPDKAASPQPAPSSAAGADDPRLRALGPIPTLQGISES
jgi:hypothetical protein